MPEQTSQTRETEASNNPKDSKPTESPKEADKPEEEPEEVVKFTPEEEAELLAESNTHKAEANSLFNNGAYDDALARYADALAVCPRYLAFELAVLHSNVSACHLKVQAWKDAAASATSALTKLDALDRELLAEEQQQDEEDAISKAGAGSREDKAQDGTKAQQQKQQKPQQDDEEDVEGEIISAGATTAAPTPTPAAILTPQAEARAKRKADIARIRYKGLMRRARASSEAGGWSDLAGAEEDYKALAAMMKDDSGNAVVMSAADKRLIAAQLRALPPRVKAAQERETAEMWGKLKELGNGILKPFGLSTENFQMQQDPKTGGYSMNFKS